MLDENGASFDRVFKALNTFAAQCARRRGRSPTAGSIQMHALVGGQFDRDRETPVHAHPRAWVEVGQGTPSQIIGASGYGKPVLDRTLQSSDPMSYALKVGCLAFDSTRISASDVDFPIDVILYERDTFELVSQRYEKQDLAEISNWWQDRLRQSVNELRSDWAEPLLSRLRSSERATAR